METTTKPKKLDLHLYIPTKTLTTCPACGHPLVAQKQMCAGYHNNSTTNNQNKNKKN
jgi:hypothetical protein